MNENANLVTQSKFFSPVFNAAIFDGPIRIYFAQHQESQALKVYFNLQERYKDLREKSRYNLQKRGGNIFIMLYPSIETFEMCFNAAPMNSEVLKERLDMDYVIGIKNALTDNSFSLLYDKIDEITVKQKAIHDSASSHSANSNGEREVQI
jgi:hypothetical protein